MTKDYNTQEREKVPVILNWLGQERFRCVQTLMIRSQVM